MDATSTAHDFSITRAAFAGFGLIARKPVSVLVWYLAAFAVLLGMAMIGTAMAGEAFQAMSTMMASGQFDPTAMREINNQIAPYNYLVLLPMRLVFGVLLGAAVLRAFLRPSDKGLFYFKIGSDEFRLFITVLVIGVLTGLMVGASILLSIIAGAAVGFGTGGFRALARGGGGADFSKLVWPILAALGALLAGLIPTIFVTTKLSLATPQTFGQRSIRIFESWALTKGKFWKIFAATLIAWIVVGIILAAVFIPLAIYSQSSGVAKNPAELMASLSYPPYSMDEYRQPARVLFYAASALALLLVSVVFSGLAAHVYLALAGEDAVGALAGSADDDDEDWDDED